MIVKMRDQMNATFSLTVYPYLKIPVLIHREVPDLNAANSRQSE